MQDTFGSAKFACTLRFTCKEVDPASGQAEEDGYEDEYNLEDLEVSALDFVKAYPVTHFRTVMCPFDPISLLFTPIFNTGMGYTTGRD